MKRRATERTGSRHPLSLLPVRQPKTCHEPRVRKDILNGRMGGYRWVRWVSIRISGPMKFFRRPYLRSVIGGLLSGVAFFPFDELAIDGELRNRARYAVRTGEGGMQPIDQPLGHGKLCSLLVAE